MDLELQRVPLDGFRPVYQTTLRQEETLESIVPDALPDIAHIVECRAYPLLRQKETVDGSIRVMGTVSAVVLYQPEQGKQLCGMTLNIPFLCTGDHPAIRGNSHARVSLTVIGADARILNPRKVLARVEITMGVTAYREEEAQLCQCLKCGEDLGLQIRTETHRDFVVMNVTEKQFSFSDVIRLSSLRPAVQSILAHRMEFCDVEAKSIGKKIIVKGNGMLSLLYLEDDGVAAARFDLPFSQIMETGAAYEDGQTFAEVVLTGLRCQEQNEGELEVTVEALVQIVVLQERELSAVADVYSVSRALEADRERITLHDLSDQGSQRQAVRQFIPMETPVQQVVECRVTTGETTILPDGSERILATAKVYANVLALTEDHTMQTVSYAMSVTCDLPAAQGDTRRCRCAVAGEGLASPVSGGIEVRFELLFHYLFTASKTVDSVSVVRPGRQEDRAGNRPSLRIRVAEAGERLWDIAKACSAAVADIQAANGIAGETLEKRTMLLIPKSR